MKVKPQGCNDFQPETRPRRSRIPCLAAPATVAKSPAATHPRRSGCATICGTPDGVLPGCSLIPAEYDGGPGEVPFREAPRRRSGIACRQPHSIALKQFTPRPPGSAVTAAYGRHARRPQAISTYGTSCKLLSSGDLRVADNQLHRAVDRCGPFLQRVDPAVAGKPALLLGQPIRNGHFGLPGGFRMVRGEERRLGRETTAPNTRIAETKPMTAIRDVLIVS